MFLVLENWECQELLMCVVLLLFRMFGVCSMLESCVLLWNVDVLWLCRLRFRFSVLCVMVMWDLFMMLFGLVWLVKWNILLFSSCIIVLLFLVYLQWQWFEGSFIMVIVCGLIGCSFSRLLVLLYLMCVQVLLCNSIVVVIVLWNDKLD